MKQEWTMRIFKADKRLVHARGRNQPGWRCVGTYQFTGRDEEGMAREVRELKHLYPEPMFKFECFPTYKTVKSLMTGEDVVIETETPLCCDPSSETYWSM